MITAIVVALVMNGATVKKCDEYQRRKKPETCQCLDIAATSYRACLAGSTKKNASKCDQEYYREKARCEARKHVLR